ncbi:competence protein CoiA [Phaeobacter gallaeciensis]|uniref:competence protein CoiA n=1 Tax=Phaeobacter gallaeciensis TaxID=60890 RepID=UPI003CD03163
MRFANTHGQRTEAKPGASGACLGCGEDLVPRCGKQKTWHWAHRKRGTCDSWREGETFWHRAWKLRFPDNWTEVVRTSCTGEKHIADVVTSSGLVIEFQHSHIHDREMRAREDFYPQMIWVVDGTRLKRDRSNFLDGMECNLRSTPFLHFVFNGYGRQITRRWQDSENLVYLDFGEEDLWCISPRKVNWQFFASRISKDDFIRSHLAGYTPRMAQRLLTEIN